MRFSEPTVASDDRACWFSFLAQRLHHVFQPGKFDDVDDPVALADAIDSEYDSTLYSVAQQPCDCMLSRSSQPALPPNQRHPAGILDDLFHVCEEYVATWKNVEVRVSCSCSRF